MLRAFLEVEMLKKCTLLWCEAHVEVKSVKNWRSQTTFRSWDDEKVHAVVARSTCPSQNVQSTPFSEHFWKLSVEKVHAVVARSTCPSQNVQSTPFSDHFWRFRCGFAWQAQGILHLCQKWANREGFVAFPKTMSGVGHLKRIWKDARRVAGAVPKTCSLEMLGGQGTDVLRRLHFGASDLQVC